MTRNEPPNKKIPPFDSYASTSPSVTEHPIDTVVRERLSEEALLDQIRDVQNALRQVLRDKHLPIWVELETLLHNRRIQREETYFNVGHEFGEIAGHSRAIRLLSNWNANDAKAVANDIRSFARRTNLPPHRTVAALLEVAWSFALLIDDPPANGSPHGGGNGHNPARGRN